MQKLGLNEIREIYLKFFESKEHLRLKSASLVPENDKSLLLISAGMAPFKPYFTGKETPPSKKVTTCQKCMRATDIENVGKTVRHGTFFEMLGNFSFGDYFKEEIIPWAWEFITTVLNIPEERLYVSIYLDDDEAYDIWNKKVGLPESKILRLGKDDNFWEVGLGPCGPCSEIHFDRGEKYGCGKETCTVGCDCDRYMEFWNLVFTQFNKLEDGSYERLEFPNIDTGMGLERMAVIMQDVESIFDVDTIRAIREKVCEVVGVTYNKSAKDDVSIRIITDHIRSITFMTADGIQPSNEGRGYVLRRLLRRAARHGKLLGLKEKFLERIIPVAIEVSKDVYPELMDKKDYILKIISIEEERFYETIDQGIELLSKRIKKLKLENKISMSGEEVFKLYDTYGFPFDLTKEILEEAGISVDEEAFKKEMQLQRERARAAREESTFMGKADTVYDSLPAGLTTAFDGYDKDEVTDAKITAIIKDNERCSSANEGSDVVIFVDKTPFYAESGGQAGDKGSVFSKDMLIEISDCIRVAGGNFAHIGKITKGNINLGDTVSLAIDTGTRLATARSHSATHLMQQALRDVLGTHVEQAGSNVNSSRLRFDFTHFAPMTDEEINKVEQIVNDKILEAMQVNASEMPIAEARNKGAMALFGEKYGDIVRVVQIGGYSTELCGGTHLQNTSQIGLFKIVSESGVAAGVRRIEAITGSNAYKYFKETESSLKKISSMLKVKPENAVKRAEVLIGESKEFIKEIEKLRQKFSNTLLEDIISNKENINGLDLIFAKVDGMDTNAIREMGDKLRDRISSGVITLFSNMGGKVNLISMSTKDAKQKGVHVGNMIREAAKIVGGGGGGRDDMAQAGGTNASKIPDAMAKAREIIKQQLANK